MAALAALALLGGCAVGLTYHRPTVTVPADFKEAAGWKRGRAHDAAPRGLAWWERYQDPVLNDLEAQVALSNLTLQQAAANYEAAREIARSGPGGLPAAHFARGPSKRSGARRSRGGSSSSRRRAPRPRLPSPRRP